VEKHSTTRQATDDNVIWRMRFACWITKATDIHSEYVILIAFPRQQWLHESASMLRRSTMSVFYDVTYGIRVIFGKLKVVQLLRKLKLYKAPKISLPSPQSPTLSRVLSHHVRTTPIYPFTGHFMFFSHLYAYISFPQIYLRLVLSPKFIGIADGFCICHMSGPSHIT
jgi:hypothetical protein